jgi:hypothetical protein
MAPPLATNPTVPQEPAACGASRAGRRHPIARFLAGLLLLAPLMACGGLARGPAPPRELSEQITVLGLPNGRFWPDTQGTALVREAQDALLRERALLPPGSALPPAYFLAISGGSDDGPSVRACYAAGAMPEQSRHSSSSPASVPVR